MFKIIYFESIKLQLLNTKNMDPKAQELIEKIYVKTQVVGANIDEETNQFYIEKYNQKDGKER